MLSVLARYSVFFSLIGHIAMAAETPNGHSGGLGHLEEVRNVVIGAGTVGHGESIQ